MRRFLLLVLALAMLGLPAPSRAGGGWTPREATYTVAVERDVKITMSDGIRLFADVLHPADADGNIVPGRFPVILTQTPYNKNGSINFRTDYLVTRGYVQVIVDVRGTGSSEGPWDSFGTREQLDGAELVAWAVVQPWSDGRIGLHGTSYGAINQLFTAALRPAGLRALFPIVPMADAYRDIVGSGGQVNTSFIPLWLGLVTALSALPATYIATDPVLAVMVLADHIGTIPQFQVHGVVDGMRGGDRAFDGPFYRQRSPIEVIDRVQAPTFLVGGWFDLFQRGTPMLFQRLQQRGTPAKLLMGPWYHITAGQGLPRDGIDVLNELELRWMDHYVRDVPDAALEAMAPVTYHRLGEDAYHTASSWPPPDVTYRQVFLGTGTLGSQPGGDPDAMIWQPASGACTRSTAQWTAGSSAGTFCDTDARLNDATGLVYDMPAGPGFDLAGPISARLFVETSAQDAFLTVRVEDVSPDGAANVLTTGWQLLSLRALDPVRTVWEGATAIQPYHPFTRESAMAVTPGAVHEVWVEIFPTAARIAAGHTLRLSIQPSDAPHLSAPVTQAATLAGGVMRLHHDADHPSALVLPVQA